MTVTSSKLCANYVTRKFKLQTMVVLLFCNMQNRTCISKKQLVRNISEEAKTRKQVVVASTSTSEPKSSANDVSVYEAKGNTEENCSRTVEIGYEAFRFSVEGQ